MTPERVADALEKYIVALVEKATNPKGARPLAAASARQTFINELRLMLGTPTVPKR